MEIETKLLIINGIKTTIDYCSQHENKVSDEAVIFVHGNSGSSKDWQSFLPRVGQFCAAVAPDMPGYGSSDRSKSFEYTVDGYGNYLYGITKELGITKIHLVLHDFGGAWGLKFAADHPELVKSIALVNIGILPGYKWHNFARIWRTPILGELFQLSATKPAFRWLLNRDNPKPFPKEFTDRMFRDSDWGMSRGMLKLYRSTESLGTLTEQLSILLKNLDLPALVLWGECDKYIPVKFAVVQKDYFDAEVIRLPECGHWPMIDNPELFANYLVPFLKMQVR